MFCFFKAQSQGPGYINRLYTLFRDRNVTNKKIHKFNCNTLANQARRVIKHNDLSQELSRIKDKAQRRVAVNTETTSNMKEPTYTPSTQTT